jgi:hypothetical protein
MGARVYLAIPRVAFCESTMNFQIEHHDGEGQQQINHMSIYNL